MTLTPGARLGSYEIETLMAGTPAQLFGARYVLAPGLSTRQYDITADGKRFLMIKDEPRESGSGASIIVVQNWFEELKRLVPVK